MKDAYAPDDEAAAHAPEIEKKSKTRIKKEMIELQKLGERLVELPEGYLKKIGLPPDLLDAVLYAKKVRTHGARRRQKQRIGVLMRDAGPSLVKTALDAFAQGISGAPPKVCKDNDLEKIMDELLEAESETIEALAARCPSADRNRLRRLVRHVRDADYARGAKARKALAAYLARTLRQDKK
jgi:ribosome-associated protein